MSRFVKNLWNRYLFILFISIFFVTSSCIQQDLSRLGKLQFYNSTNKKSFSFVISNEFVENNSSSKPDKNHPKMTRDEARLLVKLLNNNNYCVNKNDELFFVITSKQEMIYDVTFASLIDENYNAKSIAPITYFGKCL